MNGHRMPAWYRVLAWLVALAVAVGPGACVSQRDDRYVLLRRGGRGGDGARTAGEPTPLLPAADGDAGAARVRRLMSDSYAGELLRTLAMTRRLVEETAPRRSARRARAEAPTYVALGVSDRDRRWPDRDRLRDRDIGTGWGRSVVAADVPMVWIDDDPARSELGRRLITATGAGSGRSADREGLRDAVALEQIVSGLGQAIISLVVAPPETRLAGEEAAPDALGEGYVRFLNVVGAEWRSAGDTAAAAAAVRAARDCLRRADWFAAVRGNRGMARFRPSSAHRGLSTIADIAPDLALRALSTTRKPSTTSEELLRDPTVIATVLHEIAASPAGRRLAADEIYRPFVQAVPPAGISPGRLLGAFRGFQAKLLSAWNRARLAGRPPRDLVDLVEAYAAAYPEERAEVTRIFLVTTHGLTVWPGGVDESLSPEQAASALAALTADVLFGRRDLRSALPTPPSPPPARPL